MPQTKLPTFSGIGRAMACRASTVLPQADHVSEDAESGTVMHTYLERVPAIGREAALLEAPEDEQPFLASIPVEDLPTDPKGFAAEVAFAFDAASGKARELGRGLDRKYPTVGATEFVGTVDLVSLLDSDGVYVGDWKKHGRYVKHARDNWQIRIGIAAAAAAYGRARARGSIIRILDDGEVFRDRADFGAADLEQFKVDLTMLAVRILQDRAAYAKGSEVPATTGDHCRHCSSFQWCPANLTLARRIATDEPAVRAEILVTRDTAPRVLRFMQQIGALYDEVKDALDTLAAQAAAEGAPIDLGDGTVYAPVQKARESIEGGAAARAVLEADLGAEVVAKEFDLAVTKTALKAVLRKRLPGGRGVTQAEEALLTKLRKAGAVKKSTSSACAITTTKAIAKKEAA